MAELVDGLTEEEMKFLTTPLSVMDKNERAIAISIFDKRSDFRYAENVEYRKQRDQQIKETYYANGADTGVVAVPDDTGAQSVVAVDP